MEKLSQPPRMVQLDGLRGMAILLVVFNHIRLSPLYSALPASLHPFLASITSSGRTGVAILFMLSGFLMASFYPQVSSNFHFWQKRYTRIFPPFLVMCASLMVIRLFWKELPWHAAVLIIMLVSTLSGIAWSHIQNAPNRQALGYLVLQEWVPAAVFYANWPDWVRYLIYGIINASHTLPLGTYIPQLDGVYWSLITEVVFYLLFPIFFLPVVSHVLSHKSHSITALAIILYGSFAWGIAQLFNQVLGFSILEAHLSIYFIAGVGIGLWWAQSHAHSGLAVRHDWLIPVFLITGVTALFGLPVIRSYVSINPIIASIIWVIPISTLFILNLYPNSIWEKFFRQKWLVAIGTVSFSVYLTHTIAIELITKHAIPTTIPSMLKFGVQSIALTAFLTLWLFYWVEQRYFKKGVSSSKTVRVKSPPPKSSSLPLIYPTLTFLAITAFVWVGFNIPISFSAFVANHKANWSAITPITDQALSVTFTAQKNNLGLVLISLLPLSQPEMERYGLQSGPDDKGTVSVSVKEVVTGAIITQNEYPLYQLQRSSHHPIGMPIQADSAGKDYTVLIKLSSPHTMQGMALVNNGVAYRTVYLYGKKELLQNVFTLFVVAVNRLSMPFLEPAAIAIYAACLPFPFHMAYLSMKSSAT